MVPKMTAASVVAIKRVRRVNRQRSQGANAEAAQSIKGSQSGIRKKSHADVNSKTNDCVGGLHSSILTYTHLSGLPATSGRERSNDNVPWLEHISVLVQPSASRLFNRSHVFRLLTHNTTSSTHAIPHPTDHAIRSLRNFTRPASGLGLGVLIGRYGPAFRAAQLALVAN
jgi:hypothetical protein